MRRASGVTLVEMLIVLAIIGVICTIGYVNMRSWVLSNRVREAASQVTTDLERLRSNAWKTSADRTLTLGTGGTSYTLNLNGVPSSVTLPHGARMALVNGSGSVLTYTAPYGEYQATSRTITVTVPGASKTATLYIVGVTGKVIQ